MILACICGGVIEGGILAWILSSVGLVALAKRVMKKKETSCDECEGS